MIWLQRHDGTMSTFGIPNRACNLGLVIIEENLLALLSIKMNCVCGAMHRNGTSAVAYYAMSNTVPSLTGLFSSWQIYSCMSDQNLVHYSYEYGRVL